jgi:antitoxin component of RelBE/YafQ-DinJ toxin-antitoxin module
MRRNARENMELNTQINFRTSSEVKERIKDIALRRNIKPSQLINEIVSDFLNHQESHAQETIDLQTVYQMVSLQQKRLEELEKKSAA